MADYTLNMEVSPAWVHSVFIVLAVLSQILSEFFTTTFISGVYHSSSDNVSYSCSIDASLDAWASSMWIMLSVWNLVWLIYAFSTVLRRNVLGPVCCNPEVHPPLFYMTWIFIGFVRVALWFLGNDPCLVRTFALKMLIPVSANVMLGISYSNLHQHQSWLAAHSPNDYWFICFLTQNGLAMFATWTYLEAMVTLGTVLNYNTSLQDPLVSTVVLTLLLMGLVIWFTFESFIFEKLMRYTFTVYPTMILGLGSIFTRSYHFDDIAPNTVYCGVLMLFATLLNIIRLIAVCCYKDRKPSFLSQDRAPREDVCETVAQEKDRQDAEDGNWGIVNSQFSND
ncbi:uncharacterized protein LOC108937072 [Scleropages formosus]|uniref:uncharacterized protein LOC108937072 n=1 Tax=Scleropages formosus TaxID=113540 RepID=UPI0010FAC8E1|nr:uncharacterized protein LOC108937072 [Scleropages formosus]